MYKTILKQLIKAEIPPGPQTPRHTGGPKNTIVNRQKHFLFSAENPTVEPKLKMSHEQVLELLRDKGYKAESIKRLYGGKPEKSILIHRPNRKSIRHLQNLARDLGQESSIYSNGYRHEMHFHNGPNTGQHIKGQGTNFHRKNHLPQDNYSSLNDGTHFTHNFDFNTFHPHEKSLLHEMKKTEDFVKVNFKKSEIIPSHITEKHPLENPNPETKLIHYSPVQGLKVIDPNFHGERHIDEEVKQGPPKHKLSFFYLKGAKPESVVTTGVKSKYIASLGNKKLYDIGKDPEEIHNELKEKSLNNQMNPGIVSKEDYHKAIRDKGYNGIYNSSLNPTMSKVIGMFSPVEVNEEIPIHPNDFTEATDFNHHIHQIEDKKAREDSKKFGLNWKFLRKLKLLLGIKGN